VAAFLPAAFARRPTYAALIVDPRGKRNYLSDAEFVDHESQDRAFVLLALHDRHKDIPFFPVVEEVA